MSIIGDFDRRMVTGEPLAWWQQVLFLPLLLASVLRFIWQSR